METYYYYNTANRAKRIAGPRRDAVACRSQRRSFRLRAQRARRLCTPHTLYKPTERLPPIVYTRTVRVRCSFPTLFSKRDSIGGGRFGTKDDVYTRGNVVVRAQTMETPGPQPSDKNNELQQPRVDP